VMGGKMFLDESETIIHEVLLTFNIINSQVTINKGVLA